MPDIQVGDIVTIASKPKDGFWTVLHHAGFGRWRCRVEYGNSERVPAYDFEAGGGDIELLLRPTLNPGDELKMNGKRVTVISILGETVKVEIPAEDRRDALSSGHVAFGVGQAVVGLGEIISQNASKLLREQTGA